MAKILEAKKYHDIYASILGEARTGKSTLAQAFAKYYAQNGGGRSFWLWCTDGRTNEYAKQLSHTKIFVPESDVFNVIAVGDELEKDIKDGTIKNVTFGIMDNVTHLYNVVAKRTQEVKLQGGTASYVSKANTLELMRAIMLRLNAPFVILWHKKMAGDQYGKNQRMRESLSDTESNRMELAINVEMETVKNPKKPNVYGVTVKYWRYRPHMKPFTLWDEPNGMFKTMPLRILKALHEDAPADEPDPDAPFGADNPFPGKGDEFKKNALRYMTQTFKEVDGQKFYAFGDPGEEVEKKNGEPGVNGAINHAQHAYTKLGKELQESDTPTTLTTFTQWIVDDVNRRIDEAIDDEPVAGVPEPAVEEAPVEDEFPF